MPLTVDMMKRSEKIVVITPKGRIDAETNEIFQNKMTDALRSCPETIVIDMEDVYYINSSGLGTILSAYRELKKHNGHIILTHLQPQIKKVFDVLKALPARAIFENMKEVDKYFEAIQSGDISDQTQ
ncbi:MAG TPA: STAS domain-containing protein [Candidatus Omnitrophota bacterium]|nr:STAS domain-containing protein [Candidatus Omnitrophota bacterium]HPS20039.1 STAS domain-containing protein [Candidatus Omnitrophota bacterium]